MEVFLRHWHLVIHLRTQRSTVCSVPKHASLPSLKSNTESHAVYVGVCLLLHMGMCDDGTFVQFKAFQKHGR